MNGTVNEIAVWLRAYRVQHDLTQQKMSQVLGCSTSTYCAWEQSRKVPHPKHAGRIAELLGKDYEDVIRRIAEFKLQREPQAVSAAKAQLQAALDIPILGQASAGTAYDLQPENGGTLGEYIGILPPDCFCVRVRGDSMTSPSRGIYDGQMVICKPAASLYLESLIGKVVCAYLGEGEEHVIKELIRFDQRFWLKSWNAQYGLIEVNKEGARIEGVVLAVIGKL